MSNQPKDRVQCPKCMGNRYIPIRSGSTSVRSCDRCGADGWVEDTADQEEPKLERRSEPMSGSLNPFAGPWLEPFVATHACTVCEWRGVLSEAEPDADHKHVCPFCSQKNGRLRPIYEIEYEEPEPEPTGIEAMVCRDIAARQQVGIAKYGRQLSESPDDMLQHAYEEALDLACYLKTLLQQRKVADQATAEDRLLAEIFDDKGIPRANSEPLGVYNDWPFWKCESKDTPWVAELNGIMLFRQTKEELFASIEAENAKRKETA